MKTQPYICRVHIENFRNFHAVDFRLSEKQVLIGENAVGKSNLLYALQLILDPTLSEKDRMLEESDFWECLPDPMGTGEQILIEVYFANYADNQNVLAQLTDATVMLDGKETLKLTYKFFKKHGDKPDYSYAIFKGDDETRAFTYEDRKILNIRVIKAIRDVELEMRNSRTSPLTQIIRQKYTVSKDVLAEISKALEEKGADTLQIGQVGDLEQRIRTLMNAMVSFSADEFGVSLKTMNIDATRLLYTLRPLINNREAGNTSLGVNNILYIALILLLIEDDTIKTYLPSDLYAELVEKDKHNLIQRCYNKLETVDGYALNLAALKDTAMRDGLYSFLSQTIPSAHGSTILAVEEPEAHLHPIYQRLLYKHVMNKTNTSVIITTHSTHISSVAPITSLVHLIAKPDGTCVNTTAGLQLPSEEYADLARYIDVKRGELYTAKGIIFVEGIAEEYLVTSFSECLGFELDRLGLVICDINSTNFKPYCRFADVLGIPYVVITDGDYYHDVDGKKHFGDLASDDDNANGYDGLDRASRIYGDTIKLLYGEAFEELDFDQQREAFAGLDVFIGEYTFEVEIFRAASATDKAVIYSVFDQLTSGGDQQRRNFSANLTSGDYYKCLRQIESSHSGIGKGRFAQRLAEKVTPTMIPGYISNAINRIVQKVRG
ncbi:MAG: AAA family ATPase [Firmicutes bacterium]|nr:AAA family ATPase [Dethiobacter sp.]MBS3887775.1 AAA family ATPase [Bacillota bacterium]MBS4054873.1 AAA family ATPase [Thermaerobacter sp.]